MTKIDLRELLEAGCHFGHEAKRWNPKAAKYIYSTRDGIHIIDLIKTKAQLEIACEFIKKLGIEGKTLLFVGTKRQAKSIIQSEAQRVGANDFHQRWVGGFITNWNEIKKSIDKLNKMDSDKKEGKWSRFVKHEQLKLDRERMKLERSYGGVKSLKAVPAALFIVDIKKESTAVLECLARGIPTVAVVDTNCDPTKVDYPIPANDDAVKSITLIVKLIADSYNEGLTEFKKKTAEQKPKEIKKEVVQPQEVPKKVEVKKAEITEEVKAVKKTVKKVAKTKAKKVK